MAFQNAHLLHVSEHMPSACPQEAVRRASAHAPVYHAMHLSCLPNHLHFVTQVPAMERQDPGTPPPASSQKVRSQVHAPAPAPRHRTQQYCPAERRVSGLATSEQAPYLHGEHTSGLVPERRGGVLGVEGLQSGVNLIGEGCGVQRCKVKDQVVQDKFHPDPGVVGQARQGRRAAHEEPGGVDMARLLELRQKEGRKGRVSCGRVQRGGPAKWCPPPTAVHRAGRRGEVGDSSPRTGGDAHGVLRDDRHRGLRGRMLSPGSRGASGQAPGPAEALPGPRSLGFSASAPHPNSGHGPVSRVLHCNTAREPLIADENQASTHSPVPAKAAHPQAGAPWPLPRPISKKALQRPPCRRPRGHALGLTPEETLRGAGRGDVGV